MSRVAPSSHVSSLRRLPGAGSGVQIGGPQLPRAARNLVNVLVEELIALGSRNASGEWPLSGDISRARNKHETNRISELRAALEGNYDWLEVDVRTIKGALVAAHNRWPGADAMRIDDWIRVGAATKRGLKFDFKECDAIEPTLALIVKARIPHERLVINVPVLSLGGVTLEHLHSIRKRFPTAVINLSLGPRSYSASRISQAVALARAVGGPVAFPLEVGRLSRSIVQAFRAGGRVSAWNEPLRTPVRDHDAVERTLRSWGVDGTIDLR